MDLTPLYDLRERLKISGIAGTALIKEDFRLARALENFAPFESTSPVFARLGQSVRTLMDPQCESLSEALLDALALCDAIIKTQAVTGVEGEITPFKEVKSHVHNKASYGEIAPILEALTLSGGGRYSAVMETHRNNPEIFKDYRIKHGLVAALGGSYAELADQAAEWLYDEGMEIIPLLKAGFDPKGKKEMVRRIQVIEHVAGKAENDFYISLLEDSEKEIKAAAVYALRHSEDNAELLLNLAKTEKGIAKKMAHRALALLQSAEVWDYWEEQFEKSPAAAAEYMFFADSSRAAELVGRKLLKVLEPFKSPGTVLDKSTYELLTALMYVVPGKSGESICAYYEQAAALGTALDKPGSEGGTPMEFRRGHHYETNQDYLFSAFIPVLLATSIVKNPAPDLINVAKSLYQKYGYLYILPVITDSLITDDGETAYKTASPLLSPGFRIMGPKTDEKEALEALAWLSKCLKWQEGASVPGLRIFYYNPATDQDIPFTRVLTAPLSSRWYMDMLKHKDTFIQFLLTASLPDDRAVYQGLAKFFYDICRKEPKNRVYVRKLQSLGWTDYKGFFRKYCESQETVNYWDVAFYLGELPVSNQEKVAELEWLIKSIKANKSKLTNSNWEENFQDLLKEYQGKIS